MTRSPGLPFVLSRDRLPDLARRLVCATCSSSWSCELLPDVPCGVVAWLGRVVGSRGVPFVVVVRRDVLHGLVAWPGLVVGSRGVPFVVVVRRDVLCALVAWPGCVIGSPGMPFVPAV